MKHGHHLNKIACHTPDFIVFFIHMIQARLDGQAGFRGLLFQDDNNFLKGGQDFFYGNGIGGDMNDPGFQIFYGKGDDLGEIRP